MSAAGVAGDLLPEKPSSPETMATAARPHFLGNDRDGESDNLASAEKKQSNGDPADALRSECCYSSVCRLCGFTPTLN